MPLSRPVSKQSQNLLRFQPESEDPAESSKVAADNMGVTRYMGLLKLKLIKIK